MPGDNSRLTAIHNSVAPHCTTLIVRSPIVGGGNEGDVLQILESVIVGVIGTVVAMGGDEVVLDAVVARVKHRLAQQRLGNIEVAGNA